MSDGEFPICGSLVPPLLGREAIMQRMIRDLTKPTPDHLQVVGPRLAGKTVILHSLPARLREANSPYGAVLIWDLGHQTPATDVLFMRRFARELSSALQGKYADYASYLGAVQDNPYHEIAEVLDLLNEEGGKLLVIMDGFDKALSNPKLTRNLWDQLRELASKPSLRLVTASRQTLRELIRNPDAQTSDFWNIFNPTPVRVGCFDQMDLTAILASVPGLELSKGAETEIWNASNGSPVLMLSLLNKVIAANGNGEVSAEAMVDACESTYSAVHDVLDALWYDCSATSQDLFIRVRDEESVMRAGMPAADVEALTATGFVHSSGNKLQRPSRLLDRYLSEQPHEGNAIARLFGTPDVYEKHFVRVLERRIEHVRGVNPALKRNLLRCIPDLREDPDSVVSSVRAFANIAFEMIWAAEIPKKQIPSEWMDIWGRNEREGIRRVLDDWKTTFPKDSARLRLLKLMTGAEKSAPCAKYVTQGTYVLLDSAYSFGDFGQHREGPSIDYGLACAALHVCVELAAALTRELPAGK